MKSKELLIGGIVIVIGVISFIIIKNNNSISDTSTASHDSNSVSDTSTTYQETILHSFTGGKDGKTPFAGLVKGSDGNFYGTTQLGGVSKFGVIGCGGSGCGTIFKITPQGQETVLYNFAGGTDGAKPQAVLIQGNDGNFYGTTNGGGKNGFGTVFKITPQGKETILHSFSFVGGSDGAIPVAGLIQGSDGNFYGTTSVGGGLGCVGGYGCGTIFQMTPQGGYTSLYRFTGGTDGALPVAGLIQGKDGNFYGTTGSGGANNFGTVFKITPQGQETVLYNFAGGNDGVAPLAGLIQGSDGNFYGTTGDGGIEWSKSGELGYGIVFKITPQGQETILHNFAGGNDGAEPKTGLIQGSDGNFYGTTVGGKHANGTVFKITPQGQETILHSFNVGKDGKYPYGELIQGSDGNFYGITTNGGGSVDGGTVFKLSINQSLINH